MQYLLAAIGSIGDVVPILEIGRVLKRRGHDVKVLANPMFERNVREAGLPFVAAGRLRDQQRILNHPDCWSRLRGWTLWLRLLAVPTMRPMYAAIERLHRPGETVLGYGWGCFAARIARETLGMPAASVYLEPDKFRTAYASFEAPLPFLFRQWHPPAFRRFQYWLVDRGLIDPFLFKVNRFRRELGLPHQTRLLDRWWHGPDLALGLFPEWWGAAQPDWPDQVVTTGFPLGELGTRDAASADLSRFLDEGEPPVVFTPGALNRHTSRFFRAAVESCEHLGCRGLLLGPPSEMPEHLPPMIRGFDYAPFNDVFPRSSVVVHRAGIGTAVQAMAAAKPQLVLPTLYLHHDTARRLERLGIAESLSWRQLNGWAMAAAIDHLRRSGDVKHRAEVVAERLQDGSRSLESACDHLEALQEIMSFSTNSQSRVRRRAVSRVTATDGGFSLR